METRIQQQDLKNDAYLVTAAATVAEALVDEIALPRRHQREEVARTQRALHRDTR